jgi:hypothetical protein
MKTHTHARYLTYTDREQKAFDEIVDLAEKGLLPNNKNEVLRRGLLAVVHLAKVDDDVFIDVAALYLKELITPERPVQEMLDNFDHVYYFALMAQAVMIVTKGAQFADSFAPILSKIRILGEQIEGLSKKPAKGQDANSLSEIRKQAAALESTIRTLYLKG